MNWYEESTYEHVGCVEFGHHATYFFELYKYTPTGAIVALCHDEPDECLAIADVIDFAKEYDHPDYDEQQEELDKTLTKLGLSR